MARRLPRRASSTVHDRLAQARRTLRLCSSSVYPTMSVNMIAASLRRFWDDTFLRFLFSFLADKSVTKPSLTNYLECQPESCLFCSIRAFASVLTYFSAKCMTTIESLLTRAIDRFLWWETLRDQVSTLGTHDPGAVSFAEAAFRHLSPSVVPRKNIGWVFLCVFADHSVRRVPWKTPRKRPGGHINDKIG